MTGRSPPRRQAVKLTSQLGRGDLIALDGIGGFTVTSVEPYGDAGAHPARHREPRGHLRTRRALAGHRTGQPGLPARLPGLRCLPRQRHRLRRRWRRRTGLGHRSQPLGHPLTPPPRQAPARPGPATHPLKEATPHDHHHPGRVSRSPCSTRSTWAWTRTASTCSSTWPNATCCSAASPAAGKSRRINLIVAHGALSYDCKLILVDGKRVELGPWRDCADMFIGPSIKDATEAFKAFQQIMNAPVRPAAGHRPPQDHPRFRGAGLPRRHRRVRLLLRHRRHQGRTGEVRRLTRDLMARGRAAGVIVILATQRPSHQVIDPSMRDLFGYRWAFRCTTDSSSDVVLGHGWAGEGFTAASIDPLARGSAGCCRSPASRAGSRPPGSPTTTSPTWPSSPLTCGTRARPHEPRTRPHHSLRPHTRDRSWQPGQCQGTVDTQAAAATCRERRVRRVRPPRPARLQPPHRAR